MLPTTIWSAWCWISSNDLLYVFQYVVEADANLRHIALLKDLRIAELAEAVESRPLANAAESLVGHLRRFVATLDQLDSRQDLLDSLDTALNNLSERSWAVEEYSVANMGELQ